jgi:hypothetical protein
MAATIRTPLSPQQITRFRESGFLVIDTPRIDAEEIARCRRVLDRLMQRQAGQEQGRYINLGGKDPSPQILSPSLYARELRTMSCRPVLLGMAKQLLGEDACFAGDHAVLKPAGLGAATPWHQDEAFRDPDFDYEEISIWIALNDVTIDGSPMAYVPGSHRADVLPHRLHEGDGAAQTIECYAGFEPAEAQLCPIPAGAMIVHHVRTVHGAPANRSVNPRCAYILSYLRPPRPRAAKREFPWLAELRKPNRDRRKRFLLRGGVFIELLRILRSDRYADRHFLSGFMHRRWRSLARWWRNDQRST